MRIGMIGGIGPESTVDYYQRIIKLYQQKINKDRYPEIIINSVNMTSMLNLMTRQDWDALAETLLEAIDTLHQAKADFAFLASNTPHVVFQQVLEKSQIPLVSIVEAAREEAESKNLKRLGLLGTGFTMQSSFYQEEFVKSGIRLILPNKAEQQYIHEKLFSEIELGIILEDTRLGLLSIVKRLIDEDGIDGVILGCTELPLILTQSEYGIPFLNTTEIHVKKIIDKCIELAEK